MSTTTTCDCCGKAFDVTVDVAVSGGVTPRVVHYCPACFDSMYPEYQREMAAQDTDEAWDEMGYDSYHFDTPDTCTYCHGAGCGQCNYTGIA